MHSAVWAVAAAWAVVVLEVMAGSTPVLQAAPEDLRLHAHLLPDLPLGLLLPGLLLLVPLPLGHSRPERLPPEHLRRGHLLPQEDAYSRIPLEALFRSQAGQMGLSVSVTDFSLTTGLITTGFSSIAGSFHADALVASRPSSLTADFSLALHSSAGLLSVHPSGILSMMGTPDILATRQTITRSLQPQWLITVTTAAMLNSPPTSST